MLTKIISSKPTIKLCNVRSENFGLFFNVPGLSKHVIPLFLRLVIGKRSAPAIIIFGSDTKSIVIKVKQTTDVSNELSLSACLHPRNQAITAQSYRISAETSINFSVNHKSSCVLETFSIIYKSIALKEAASSERHARIVYRSLHLSLCWEIFLTLSSVINYAEEHCLCLFYLPLWCSYMKCNAKQRNGS